MLNAVSDAPSPGKGHVADEPDHWALGYAAFGCADPKEPPADWLFPERVDWWHGYNFAKQQAAKKR